MKKSSSIKLVLIGAALASCNRMIIPSQSVAGNGYDSSLISPPLIDSDSYNNSFNLCCNEVLPIWNYSFNLNLYPANISQPVNNSARLYKRGHCWRNSHFIVRDGWGRSGGAAHS
jgi:hypothetical protein